MENNRILEKVFQRDFLTEREKKIFVMRLEGTTLEEIGKVFGVSRERIRQLGEGIKRKLHGNLSAAELKEYLSLRQRMKIADAAFKLNREI